VLCLENMASQAGQEQCSLAYFICTSCSGRAFLPPPLFGFLFRIVVRGTR
jgi:hypothetical protein